MSKLREDCCRHGHQCPCCKLWYCADDEIVFCRECIHHDDAMCHNCLGLPDDRGQLYFCKWHWEPRQRETLKNKVRCLNCLRYRRINIVIDFDEQTEKFTYVCNTCYKQDPLKYPIIYRDIDFNSN